MCRYGRCGSSPDWQLIVLGGLCDCTTSSPTALPTWLNSVRYAAPSSATPAEPWTPTPFPSARALFLDNLQRQIAKLKGALREITHPAAILHGARAGIPALRELLADEPGPQTSLNRVIGQDRTLALVRSSLELVNEVARVHDAKVNDVLLAVIAGGLRGLLRSRGEPIEGVTLPIYVPVSLRRGRAGQEGGNLISQMVVPLPLGIAEPGRRLLQIAAETAKRKAISHRLARCSTAGSSEGRC